MGLSSYRAAPPKERNIVFVGVPYKAISGANPAVTWSDSAVTVGSTAHKDVIALVAFPLAGRQAAAMVATRGAESLLYRIQPFTSRIVFPDYFVYSAAGTRAAGFFDAQWKLDPSLGN